MKLTLSTVLQLLGAFAITTAAALPASSMAQMLYKSTGADGKIIYSDRPSTDGRIDKAMKMESPPLTTAKVQATSAASAATQVGYGSNAPTTSAIAPSTMPPSAPVASQASAATGTAAPVLLYAAAWCPSCRNAKAYLAAKRLTYQEIDVDTTAGSAALVKAGGKAIPLMTSGSLRLTGYSAGSYDDFFAKRK